MPFGLKNAGAIYQRMIQTSLEKQIGKIVEAYIDDVVIKTRHVKTLIDDLCLTFNNLWAYDIKLNPEKCVFGVPAGKLLGFLISKRGIEANPEKIKAIERMRKPARLHDVHKFTGCLPRSAGFLAGWARGRSPCTS